jgi:hypothetical protein
MNSNHAWGIYRKEKDQWKIIKSKKRRPITYSTYGNALGVFILARLNHHEFCIAPA